MSILSTPNVPMVANAPAVDAPAMDALVAAEMPEPPSWHKFPLVDDAKWNPNFVRVGWSPLPPHFGTPVTADGKYTNDGKTRLDYLVMGLLHLVTKQEPILRSEMFQNILTIHTASNLSIQVVFSRFIDPEFPNDVICVDFLRTDGSGMHIEKLVKSVVADIEASYEVRGGAMVYD